MPPRLLDNSTAPPAASRPPHPFPQPPPAPMYLLPCSCGESVPVAASQAGNVVTCPRCGNSLQVPKLGQLRRLRTAAPDDGGSVNGERLPLWRRLLFAILAAIVMGSAGWSLFSLFKWRMTEVPATMAQHLEQDRQQIEHAPPAELARLWDELEAHGLYEQRPFAYQVAAENRASWRRMTLASAVLAAVSAAAAVLLAVTGRRRRAEP